MSAEFNAMRTSTAIMLSGIARLAGPFTIWSALPEWHCKLLRRPNLMTSFI
jgi:hypothetical protein